MKNLSLFLILFTCITHAQTTRVLVVGDSWAEQQYDDGIHETIFSINGFADVNVAGDSTVESGTEAAEWATIAELQKIEFELDSNPAIDTVQLTVGGNDFLNNWSINMTSQQEMALQQQIQTDITTIVDFILAYDDSIEVILSFYDYPNFVDTLGGLSGLVCSPLLQDLGSPTTSSLNNAIIHFESIYAKIASENPRVYHVSHLGLMQNFYNGITLPGDISLPSPASAMREHPPFGSLDCFHLNPISYEVLVQNLFDNYFHLRFDTLFKNGFE